MNKKLIGLISVFILAEIVCIIGFNVQSALSSQNQVWCYINDPNCTLEWINAYNKAESDKVGFWIDSFLNIAYIFVILLMILLPFSYYKKRKKNSAFSL